ncbi:hypothetical protein CS022_20360 [Veronia nyctiphanis]|uniref:Uncharacterized protein n=1 Tax=Veronia nyctiphanis TaxID=1278244 RepID=A0A4Q0YLA4_9GAMM|nr:hypothetical protein [Veronia nyctiphanis]RXJ71567.1 hypothetical protein CS022_20360 [Veronia nyctiphanis]
MKQLILNIIALFAGLFVLMLSGAFVIVVSLVVLILSPILKKKVLILTQKLRQGGSRTSINFAKISTVSIPRRLAMLSKVTIKRSSRVT